MREQRVNAIAVQRCDASGERRQTRGREGDGGTRAACYRSAISSWKTGLLGCSGGSGERGAPGSGEVLEEA